MDKFSPKMTLFWESTDRRVLSTRKYSEKKFLIFTQIRNFFFVSTKNVKKFSFSNKTKIMRFNCCRRFNFGRRPKQWYKKKSVNCRQFLHSILQRARRKKSIEGFLWSWKGILASISLERDLRLPRSLARFDSTPFSAIFRVSPPRSLCTVIHSRYRGIFTKTTSSLRTAAAFFLYSFMQRLSKGLRCCVMFFAFYFFRPLSRPTELSWAIVSEAGEWTRPPWKREWTNHQTTLWPSVGRSAGCNDSQPCLSFLYSLRCFFLH